MKRPKKSLPLYLTFVLVAGVLVFFGGLFTLTKAYEGKIHPNTYIGPVAVGNLTAKEARTKLNQQITKISQEATLAIDASESGQWQAAIENSADGLEEVEAESSTLTSTEIEKIDLTAWGVAFDTRAMVDQAINLNRTENPLATAFTQLKSLFHSTEVTPIFTISEAAFNKKLSEIRDLTKYDPENAEIKIENGQVVITPGQLGEFIDTSQVRTELEANLKHLKPFSIRVSFQTAQPEITSADLQQAAVQAGQLLAASPVLTHNGKEYRPDSTTIAGWIVFSNENGQVIAKIDRDQAGNYINKIGNEIDYPVKDKKVYKDSKKVIQEGKDGLALDREKALTDLLTSFKSDDDGPVQLAASTVQFRTVEINDPAAEVPLDANGKLIQVNLSKQMAYAYQDGEQVFSTAISSGVAGHPTPTGTFRVLSKTASMTMSGPGYYLPNVQWNLRVIGSYFIHGTYWHNNFGHPMSHGCVNLSNSAAQWFYGWAPVGTVVRIHY